MKKLFSISLAILIALSMNTLIGKADSPRKVLIEEATNASCGPCALQNPTFQKFLNNHTDKIIPLIYHAWFPGVDPMYNEDENMNGSRIRYYGIEQQGVPNCRINGKTATPSSSSYYAGAPSDTTALLTELNNYQSNSPTTMTVTEQRNGTACTVNVSIQTSQSLVGKKLRVAVVEYYIGYDQAPGTNGERDFYWVARKMLPDYNGTTLDLGSGSQQTYTFNYTMKSNWNSGQIYIVAFIQDDQTKEVLQAAQNLKVTRIQAQATANPFLTIARNGQLTYKFQVTNPNNELIRVGVQVNTGSSYIPTGWQATASVQEVTLTPNETKEVSVTVKSSNKAEFGIVTLQFSPKVNNPYESINGSVYVLTEDTKYACYVLGNTGTASAAFVYQALSNNPKYSNDVALLPFAIDIMTNYPLTRFDLVALGFTYALRGVLGGYFLEAATLYPALNAMISSGKSILLTSEIDLTFAFGSQGSATARDFYQNKLFIQNNNYQARFTQQGSQVILNSYQANGVAGDPIGNGLTFTMNNSYNQQTYPYYILFTDFIAIRDANKTKSFLYYDNDPTKIGGVRVENGNSRLAYLTSGFEAIGNSTQRNNFIGRIVDWLLAKIPSTIGPQIQLSNSSLDFLEVPVNTSKSLSCDITNTGDEDLVITEISVDRDFDPDGVFTISNPPTLPLTIKPNQKYTLNIQFLPTEEKTYFSSVIIKSNAKNSPDEIVSLDGIGVAANVPIISVNKTDIDFRDVVPQSSKVLDVDVKNDGLADLEISSITILGNDASAFTLVNAPELPKTLGPGEVLTLTIMFTPSKEGTHNATLRIQSNAQNIPTLNINLIGNGVSSVSETEFASGIQIKVAPHPVVNELNLQITNPKLLDNVLDAAIYDLQGNLILYLGSISINSGENAPKFSVSTIPSGTYQIRLKIGSEIRFVPIIISR